MPFTAGQRATLNNAGVIDLSSGNTRTNDALTVQGNYSGNGGQLLLQSAVGDDNSPSDKLVVIDGTLTGTTSITVSNLGGAGALTQQNGIQVVQAQGTAISDNGAFTLKTPVSAGAFDYVCSRAVSPPAAKTVGTCAPPSSPCRWWPSRTPTRPAADSGASGGNAGRRCR